MNATLDGSEASVIMRAIRTAMEITATETTDLVLPDVLMDTREPCV